MPQINQLSAIDTPQAGDQLPLYSSGNGDARKLSFGRLATWIATALSNVTIGGYVRVRPVLVSQLPSAVTAGVGARAFVTDATNSTFHAAPVGGGAVAVPVYSDGVIWRIG